MKAHAVLAMIGTIFIGSAMPKTAGATTIDPLTWEQMAEGADFVGIVECITAGGIVARYRVVESWKGPAAGTEFHLQEPPNYWGPQYPITLCGERLLVMAYKSAPLRIMSTTSGSPVPLWWRRFPSDYETPLFQGRWRLYSDREDLREFGRTVDEAEEVAKLVREFLAKEAREREFRVLHSVARKTFGDLKTYQKPAATNRLLDGGVESTIVHGLAETEDVDAFVKYLMDKGKADKQFAMLAARILEEGGGRGTLAILKTADPDAWGEHAGHLAEAGQEIQSRLQGDADAAGGEAETEPTREVVSEERLKAAREALEKTPWSEEGYEAMHLLTVHAPEVVADKLLTWRPAAKKYGNEYESYSVGSVFCFVCGKDREAQFRKLLKAEMPYIRVAAAVYLCFENAEAGKQALKELCAVPDDPGAWAALTLVRRGDKAAMKRALEVLNPEKESNMNFQGVLLTVLSNSAKSSGVEQPPRLEDYLAEDAPEAEVMEKLGRYFEAVKVWWAKHEEVMTLRDPWMEVLEKQKVD
jgi:hypothetical protein